MYPVPGLFHGRDYTNHGSKPSGLRTIVVQGRRQSRPHRGLDFPDLPAVLSSRPDVPILNFHRGVITKIANDQNGFGHYIKIKHDNIKIKLIRKNKTIEDSLTTIYAHLQESPTRYGLAKGQQVGFGELLGFMGTTGNSTSLLEEGAKAEISQTYRSSTAPAGPANDKYGTYLVKSDNAIFFSELNPYSKTDPLAERQKATSFDKMIQQNSWYNNLSKVER
jgi:hypothetical protein